jgi:hypothetical protein
MGTARMNMFGAFTFGSLIKTFLPGLVWLAAIVLLEADIAQLLGVQNTLWTFAQSKDQAALVLAIPVSILLGLLSNMVVFMGVNDVLVRSPVRKANPELSKLYDELCTRVKLKCWGSLEKMDPAYSAMFTQQIDAEIVLLNSMGVEKLAYVREQYWYHLEFQLNLILSVAAIAGASIFSILLNAGSTQARVVWVAVCVIAALLTILGLLAAARKNYARHVAKMASAMAAALCIPDAPCGTG